MKAEAVTSSYRRWAPIYDAVFGRPLNAGRRRSTARATQRGGRVLEVGVGTGLALPLYGRDLEIVAIDYSAEMLERAETKITEHGLDNVTLHQMDAQELAFPDESFDTVTAMHVLSVVPDPARALSEMARVCRPGGRVMIVNHFSASGGPLRVVERMIQPLQDKLGWQADFPLSLVTADPRLKLIESRRMPPVGIMTWLELERI